MWQGIFLAFSHGPLSMFLFVYRLLFASNQTIPPAIAIMFFIPSATHANLRKSPANLRKSPAGFPCTNVVAAIKYAEQHTQRRPLLLVVWSRNCLIYYSNAVSTVTTYHFLLPITSLTALPYINTVIIIIISDFRVDIIIIIVVIIIIIITIICNTVIFFRFQADCWQLRQRSTGKIPKGQTCFN